MYDVTSWDKWVVFMLFNDIISTTCSIALNEMEIRKLNWGVGKVLKGGNSDLSKGMIVVLAWGKSRESSV